MLFHYEVKNMDSEIRDRRKHSRFAFRSKIGEAQDSTFFHIHKFVDFAFIVVYKIIQVQSCTVAVAEYALLLR